MEIVMWKDQHQPMLVLAHLRVLWENTQIEYDHLSTQKLTEMNLSPKIYFCQRNEAHLFLKG